MDPEFDEAFAAYKERNERRKSLYIRPDITAIDTSKTHTNILLILMIITFMLAGISAVCYYIELD